MLVDDGCAVDYPGSIDDYIDFILGRNQPKTAGAKPKPVPSKVEGAKKLTGKAKALKQAAADAEAASAKLTAECAALDKALALACANTVTDLTRRRAQVAQDLAKAEAHWLEVSEQLEQMAA